MVYQPHGTFVLIVFITSTILFPTSFLDRSIVYLALHAGNYSGHRYTALLWSILSRFYTIAPFSTTPDKAISTPQFSELFSRSIHICAFRRICSTFNDANLVIALLPKTSGSATATARFPISSTDSIHLRVCRSTRIWSWAKVGTP